jgi:hypothetical protein
MAKSTRFRADHAKMPLARHRALLLELPKEVAEKQAGG